MLCHLCDVIFDENRCGPIRTCKRRDTDWLINYMRWVNVDTFNWLTRKIVLLDNMHRWKSEKEVDSSPWELADSSSWELVDSWPWLILLHTFFAENYCGNFLTENFLMQRCAVTCKWTEKTFSFSRYWPT